MGVQYSHNKCFWGCVFFPRSSTFYTQTGYFFHTNWLLFITQAGYFFYTDQVFFHKNQVLYQKTLYFIMESFSQFIFWKSPPTQNMRNCSFREETSILLSFCWIILVLGFFFKGEGDFYICGCSDNSSLDCKAVFCPHTRSRLIPRKRSVRVYRPYRQYMC